VRTPADNQLPFALADGTSDPWVAFQHIDGIDDFPNPQFGVFNLVSGEVLEDAIKILTDLWRQLYA
jgi:hypothetical protein